MKHIKLFETWEDESSFEMETTSVQPRKEYSDEGLSNRQIKGQTNIEEESSVLLDDESFTVVIPHSHRAAIYWSKGANWDTSDRNTDVYFTKYNDIGELFIIHDKTNGNKFQLHVSTDTLADSNNRIINCAEFFANSHYEPVYNAIYEYTLPENRQHLISVCGK
jgi:hypothetical protein